MTMEEILTSGLAELGVPATAAQLSQLRAYYTLLDERLEGDESSPPSRAMRRRRAWHFSRQCRAAPGMCVSPGKAAADIGSGAGFPGLVAAILAPDADITLIDSLQKRVTFQQEVCDTVGLGNVTCLAGRAEEESALRESFEVVTSRAVARMTMLCELCLPLVRVGGVFAAMKGPEPEEEVQEAARCIRTLGGGKPRIEKYTVPGTDAVHSVVIIPKTAPTPAKYPRRFAMIKKQPL